MSSGNRAKLRELAEKVLPRGPWGFARADYNSGLRPWITQLEAGAASGAAVCTVQPNDVRDRGNLPFPLDDPIYDKARFIAACDPDTILKLLAVVDAAETVLDARSVEETEDAIDHLAVAWAGIDGPPVPWEQVKKEAGLV